MRRRRKREILWYPRWWGKGPGARRLGHGVKRIRKSEFGSGNKREVGSWNAEVGIENKLEVGIKGRSESELNPKDRMRNFFEVRIEGKRVRHA